MAVLPQGLWPGDHEAPGRLAADSAHRAFRAFEKGFPQPVRESRRQGARPFKSDERLTQARVCVFHGNDAGFFSKDRFGNQTPKISQTADPAAVATPLSRVSRRQFHGHESFMPASTPAPVRFLIHLSNNIAGSTIAPTIIADSQARQSSGADLKTVWSCGTYIKHA